MKEFSDSCWNFCWPFTACILSRILFLFFAVKVALIHMARHSKGRTTDASNYRWKSLVKWRTTRESEKFNTKLYMKKLSTINYPTFISQLAAHSPEIIAEVLDVFHGSFSISSKYSLTAIATLDSSLFAHFNFPCSEFSTKYQLFFLFRFQLSPRGTVVRCLSCSIEQTKLNRSYATNFSGSAMWCVFFLLFFLLRKEALGWIL